MTAVAFLNDTEQDIQSMARDFAQREVAPRVAQMEKGDLTVIRETWDLLAETGIPGLIFPEQYGGSGLSTVSYLVALEEIAKISASFAVTLSVHVSVGTLPILLAGNDEQKERYLPDLVSGKKLAAFALTEPDAGSDAGSGTTKGERDGDAYLLHGSKIFISSAQTADVFVVTARTLPEVKGPRGLAAFVIDRTLPGFHVEKGESKLGLCGGDWGELRFDNCRIEPKNRLGEDGEGFILFMRALEAGRIGIGAVSVGLGQACLEASLQYAKQRKQFGKSLSDFQITQFKLANMAMEIEAARHLVHNAGRVKDSGRPCTIEASYAKLFASEMCNRCATEAVQIFGGYGYTKDFPVERFFRDAKAMEIVEGTSQIQRIIIARQLLDA